MSEGLQNQQTIPNQTEKETENKHQSEQNTSRSSPNLDLKKQGTIRSFRSSRSLRSNLKNIPKEKDNSNTNTNNNKDNNNKKTVLRTIRQLFVKASINLSIAATKLKNFAEDALSSDEIINELFLVTSSSSVDSSLLEGQEQQQQEEGQEGQEGITMSEPSNEQSNSETNSEENQSNIINESSYENFDSVLEAKKLHKELGEDKPFINGEDIWQKRRNAWLYSNNELKSKAKQRSLDNSLVGISKDNYPIIYNSLIEKQKTLKKPMNLKDALKVINAGWIASKKWERATQGLA